MKNFKPQCIILFIVLIIFFTSCKSNKEKLLISDLKESYSRSIKHSAYISNLYLNQFEVQYAINHSKVKPYYDRALLLKTFAEDFYKLADSIISDSLNTNFEFESIRSSYLNSINSMKKELPQKIVEYAELNYDNLKAKRYSDKYPKLSVMILKNDMAINLSKLYIALISQVSSSDPWFINIKVSAKNEIINDSNAYSFVLLSKHLQKSAEKVIYIDTVLFNNKIKDISLNIQPTYEFSRIKIDSAKNGNYVIKGRVKLITEFGKSFYYPFTHKFQVKNNNYEK